MPLYEDPRLSSGVFFCCALSGLILRDQLPVEFFSFFGGGEIQFFPKRFFANLILPGDG